MSFARAFWPVRSAWRSLRCSCSASIDLAGLVALIGLVMSGLMLWTVIAWLGETQGLAITLAGVVGLIVSIGVSADSNIVYFENVKDVVRSGRRIPTLSIGPTRRQHQHDRESRDVVSSSRRPCSIGSPSAPFGAATYLGIATMLDLIIATTFMRPALTWISQLPAVKKNPRLLGIRSANVVGVNAQAGEVK
ncbi:MAG: hypothetical protein R2706_12990 [Acidimicrobiales bacterium]